MQQKPSESANGTQFRADTLIVAARVESFWKVFVSERAWYPLRIDDRRKTELKWICVYQNDPVRAITHYANIIRIENYHDTGRYKIIVGEPVELPIAIALGSEGGLTMQGQKYTSFERVLKARLISDLRPWNR